jgi:hypothetical protein
VAMAASRAASTAATRSTSGVLLAVGGANLPR